MKPSRSDGPQLFYGQDQKRDFRELIQAYGAWELQSPARSTVFLLAYWNRDVALQEFGDRIGHEFRGLVKLFFEHPVSVKAGKGKPSFTDLFILSDECSIAIEAKHSEPPYPIVSEWLNLDKQGNSSDSMAASEIPAPTNRLAVLQGWLDAINEKLKSTLDVEGVRGLTYQLLHRTASACEGEGVFKAVVYQCFDPTAEHRKYYRRELKALRDLIGLNAPIRFIYLECRSTRTGDYQDLLVEWQDLKPYAKRLYRLRSRIGKDLHNRALLGFAEDGCTAISLE
jgi:hypothetical protein